MDSSVNTPILTTFLDMGATAVAGSAKRQIAYRKAAQLEDMAGEAKAIGQRTARAERQRKEIVASRALAVAAASGAGVSDPTMVNILSDIEGEGAYRESFALYEGEAEARQLLSEASNIKAGIKAQRQGEMFKQVSTVMSGAGKIYGAKDWGGKPPPTRKEIMKRRNDFGYR